MAYAETVRPAVRVEKVFIVSHWWDVHWYDLTPDELPDDPDNAENVMRGYCFDRYHAIHVYDGSWQTFYHEATHAVLISLEIDLPHDLQVKIESGILGMLSVNRMRLGQD